ncbi:MAG: hypothetical protein O9272_02665 [Brevundimonas sp.]|nr:hypothetical protein [Brevundimonas sp.]
MRCLIEQLSGRFDIVFIASKSNLGHIARVVKAVQMNAASRNQGAAAEWNPTHTTIPSARLAIVVILQQLIRHIIGINFAGLAGSKQRTEDVAGHAQS